MSKSHKNEEQPTPSVIDSTLATRLYAEGMRRFRKPERRSLTPDSIDTNSWDFRGQRASWDVVKTLPHDERGVHITASAEEIRTHMGLALTAIQEVGKTPLAGDFVAGYTRWVDAIANEAAKLQEATAVPTEPTPPIK